MVEMNFAPTAKLREHLALTALPLERVALLAEERVAVLPEEREVVLPEVERVVPLLPERD